MPDEGGLGFANPFPDGKILGREPTLWISTINIVVVLIGTLGLKVITGQQAGLIVAAIDAVFLAINAYFVRPISPAAFTYAIGAVVAVAASYGLNVTADQVSVLNAGVIPVLALITRNQVSPAQSAITKG